MSWTPTLCRTLCHIQPHFVSPLNLSISPNITRREPMDALYSGGHMDGRVSSVEALAFIEASRLYFPCPARSQSSPTGISLTPAPSVTTRAKSPLAKDTHSTN